MSDPSVVVLPPPQEPQRIAILGAGMAGLAAAEILVNAGHDVSVFEAQVRPGGRVLTSRQNFAEGLHVELGASRFPDCHDLTLAYCRRLGLNLVDFGSEDLKPLLSLDGRRLRDSGPLPASLGLPASEHGLTLKDLEARYLEPLLEDLGDPLDPNWPNERLLAYDDLSYTELLLKHGASKKAIGLIGTGFNVGEGLDGASALWMLRNHKLDRARRRLFKLKEGNDRLPQALALQLSSVIRYGVQVVALKQDRGGVEVGYLRLPFGRFSERFDRVICTLPFPLVRDLDVSPPILRRQAQGRARAALRFHGEGAVADPPAVLGGPGAVGLRDHGSAHDGDLERDLGGGRHPRRPPGLPGWLQGPQPDLSRGVRAPGPGAAHDEEGLPRAGGPV